MNFLIDAQLPRRLAWQLRQMGHDALHTLDLPGGNATTDAEIILVADSQARIVVSKDDDFVQSHLIQGRPARLLLVSTGNIRNIELERLFMCNIGRIEMAFATTGFVELTYDSLIVHG